MSRRLAITSLLCDDDPPNPPDRIVPETVILAPHLAVRKHGGTHPRPPPPKDAQSLDALAQAAALHRSDPFPPPYATMPPVMPPPVRYEQPRRYWDHEEPGRPFTSPSTSVVEPPHKKRRPSDVAMPHTDSMSLRHTGTRSILNPEPSPIYHNRAPVSAGIDPTPFGYRGPMTLGPQDTNPHFCPPTPEIQAHPVIHLTERAHDDYLVEDRKAKKPSASRSPEIPRSASHQRRPPQPKPKEEDAHDWLLGQLPEGPSKRTPEPPKPPVVALEPEPVAAPTLPNGTEDDKMDIDVDDELLSLVDGPSRPAKAPSRHASPASSMPPPSDRGSMPPPASTVVSKKKKEPAKPKPKAPAKPRAKPAAKPKPKPSEKAKPSAISRKSGSAAASRSRSNSAMPGGSVGPDGSEKPDEDEDEPMPVAEDDKLYCICKTTYDEDRFMIACDKCDEWYHTQCVDMADLVVDLVDQFFCPPCIAKNPELSLVTTYKPRCRNGLDHPEPDSPTACHKPAKGALSKYCSDECGLNTMKMRIEKFAHQGGKKEQLWETVKHAQKREAVVVLAGGGDECAKENGNAHKPAIGRVEREEGSLNAVLEEVVAQREDLRQGMDMIIWRERVLDLASERAEQTGQCGWDGRLMFGEQEWALLGDEVLDNYDKAGEEWWCAESEHCERHAGWKTLRVSEVAKEKENKEEALRRLTTRERELRKRIEDIVEPYNRSCRLPAALKSSTLVNGNKKGKKRKNFPS